MTAGILIGETSGDSPAIGTGILITADCTTALQMGVSGTPAGDFVWYGTTALYAVTFDEDGDTNGSVEIGADTYGLMFNLYGDVTGCGVFWDPSTDTNGTLSVGAAGGSKGVDMWWYGDTASATMQWDQGTDDLIFAGGASVVIGTCTYGVLMEGVYSNPIRITTDVATTNSGGIRLLNTYTAADGYHVGIMGAAIWNPTAASGYGGVIGVFGEANIQGDFTGGTNYSFGVRGTLQLTDDTVINDGSSIFGAINASMKDDATPTLTAGHICGVYIENLIDADLSSITGISSLLYMANNASATCTIDSAIYLYGPKVTYFAQIYDGTVSGCIAASAGAANGKYLVMDVDGVVMKLAFLANS